MFIALENIFNGGDEKIELDYEFDFTKEEFNGGFPFTKPVKLKGVILNEAGLVTIDAKCDFTMETVCDRCAEKIEPSFSISILHGLVASLNDEENDDYIIVEDMQLDIEALTLEDIYLALPIKMLCKEDCKGLCPKCGANLNEKSCNCKKEIDPRLEALMEFLDE